MKIYENKIQCKKCGDVIESKTVHDMVWCKCGAVAVDGGKEYLRRTGNDKDIIELSKYEESNRNNDITDEEIEKIGKILNNRHDMYKRLGEI
ncbi:hypothetical protein CLOBY_18340 [Clostridium saccharobutylicum]|uniref:DUF7695 domain-containing protein n=1 Tax=Clostridium saccharobutylicum TaxID=169679 RepID=UPI000983C43E|nr:hypothetical protein [Clostridium saccharobutylicum]AQS09703.1 hypothetical protein CLOBY_18340 [Clostridium saccharobutylicum]MBC2436903.1 hypothetical protein [Clostridium saccharobutylicum]NSB89251.1 putative Zn finger protein [Clostridium saccharobutylicum]NYC27905.1 putative Zn finger protein [Clostridium saccharobutylicum]OOM17102.1 hypothetical protein CLSAB_20500 [Clostridium saccharobutylicum]